MAVKILIIENNASVARDLQNRLQNFGYEVIGICTSHNDTIKYIESLAPEMIIMDIHLKKANDGIKTGALIQTEYDIPVIYMTDSFGQTTLRRATGTGPFGYIFFPFTDRQIITTIEIASLRNQFEKQIQEGQKWLTGILNSIADGVVAINKDGQIRYINPVARDLTGWNEKDAIGKPVQNVITLIDEITSNPIDLWTKWKTIYETGHPPAFQALLRTETGQDIAIEVNITTIAGTESQTGGMVVAFRDIRKQRESLNEIQRQAERAQTLVKSAEQLNSDLELNNVLDLICKLTNGAIKASGTALFLLDRKKGSYFKVSANSDLEQLQAYAQTQFTIPADLVDTLVSTPEQVMVLDHVQRLSQLPYLELLQRENISTVVLAGILHNREVMGFLVSAFIHPPNLIQHADLELLKGLADQAAISITNANLFRQVRIGREQQRKLARSMVDVQEEERRHIARELHDQLGQILTGLQFMVKSAKKQEGSAQQVTLEEIQETVGSAIGQVREMSLNLRPGMLDDMGLLPTLEWHIERFHTQTGIRVNFHNENLVERLPPAVETTAYRIVQEALTNVARHTQVNEVFVGLVVQEQSLWIEILDQGKGFDLSAIANRPSSGLSGMRERASLIGGYVVIESFINQGTQIVAALPLTSKPLERRKIDRNRPSGR